MKALTLTIQMLWPMLKIFVEKQRNRQTGQKLYAPDLLINKRHCTCDYAPLTALFLDNRKLSVNYWSQEKRVCVLKKAACVWLCLPKCMCQCNFLRNVKTKMILTLYSLSLLSIVSMMVIQERSSYKQSSQQRKK